MNSVSERWSMPPSPQSYFQQLVMAKKAETFYKRLASLLAAKWDNQYNTTLACMDLLQTLLLFIKISYQMHQGHAGQDACGHALKSPESLVLVRAESGINPTQF